MLLLQVLQPTPLGRKVVRKVPVIRPMLPRKVLCLLLDRLMTLEIRRPEVITICFPRSRLPNSISPEVGSLVTTTLNVLKVLFLL